MRTNIYGKFAAMTDSRIYIDTAPFIYYLEMNALYFDRTRTFFKNCYENHTPLVTSAVTVEEYCIHPLSLGDEKSAEDFQAFISGMNIDVVPCDRLIALEAARIRAKYKAIKALDAIHLATALFSECQVFVTNDKQLRQIHEINVVTMDSWPW